MQDTTASIDSRFFFLLFIFSMKDSSYVSTDTHHFMYSSS